jgi:hypothetical protein
MRPSPSPATSAAGCGDVDWALRLDLADDDYDRAVSYLGELRRRGLSRRELCVAADLASSLGLAAVRVFVEALRPDVPVEWAAGYAASTASNQESP